MSKRRINKIPAPTWEHEESGLTRRLDANRWQLWATVGIIALVVAALGLVSWGFLSDYIEDQQRPGSLALRVEDREISVRDFGQRAELLVQQVGSNSAFIVMPTLSRQLIEEGVFIQYADERSVTASDEEIQQQLADTLGIAADDPNFDALLQEELNRSGLTEEQYRDIARAAVLRVNLRQSFRDELPNTLPAVHYRQIQVADRALADDLLAQLDEGADFVALAAENSLDTATSADGGDMGFVPEGFLDQGAEDVLFNLEVDDTTIYEPPGSTGVFIYQVVEKSDAREITDEQKDGLAANALTEWLADKQEAINIQDEMDFTNGDPKKIEWVIGHADLTLGGSSQPAPQPAPQPGHGG